MSFTEKLAEIEQKMLDLQFRGQVDSVVMQFHTDYQNDLLQFKDYELVKSQAAYIRSETLSYLDTHLLEFEKHFIEKGGKLLWATSEKDAFQVLDQIVEAHHITNISTNPDSIQEINLRAYCTNKNIVFQQQKDTKENSIEILQTDFLIADIGALAVRQALPSVAISKSAKQIQIAIVGIEKIIPQLKDLALIWDVLSINSKKQAQQIQKAIITPSKTKKQTHQDLYVILLDKERTQLLANKTHRQALHCINCDACMQICPIFRNFGVANVFVSSPIQAVKSSFTNNSQDAQKLNVMSTLCGACAEICPVKIEIPELLLSNRLHKSKANKTSNTEKLGFFVWKRAMLKRQRLEAWQANYKNFLFRKLFKRNWGKRQELPSFAPKSFHQLWIEKQKR